MKVGSIFSGMEGFGHGFIKAGMTLSWWVENDKNCIKVLRAKYPDALGITDVKEARNLPAIDLISFGWPCQDLSVAGNRAGLAGSRSGLFWEAMRIVEQLSPQWIIGENVPGLLSSESGRDMGAVIRAMEELGYCISWAMLDTQYFHLAQRRERLFFVGSLGNTSSIQVLFEPDCGPWDSPPRREKGKEVAGTIGGGSESSKRGWRNDLDTQGAYVIKGTAINQAVDAEYLIAFSGGQSVKAGSLGIREEQSPTLKGSPSGSNMVPTVAHGMLVRRLTPTECLRLQGFPDDYLDNLGLSDSAKYRMIGNSVSPKITEWIGRRIMEAEIN